MHELLRLLLQHGLHLLVAIAERVDGDAATEIEIPFAVGVIQIRAFTMIQHERWALVRLQHVLFFLRHELLCVRH